MRVPPSSESDMSAHQTPCLPRKRERRAGIAEIAVALSRAVADRADPALIRGAFEEALRRVVALRSVRLRDPANRWTARAAEAPEGAESIAFEVPGPGVAGRGVLEATFDPGGCLGEWDFQTLGTAAHLAALVLEVERCRVQVGRAMASPAVPRRRDGAAPLIGSTEVMQTLRATIERVAATDFTVLLEGESGVGKELVARLIHDLSRRRTGPFVALNCAALVETLVEAELFGIEERTATGVRGRRGKFEHADTGTLFLDEVSDLSLAAQAKVLRAIQDLSVERVGGNGSHRVDIRIIAATNRSLSGLVERKLFRPDLYYRLSGVDVCVPSLRDRRPDILELADYFLHRHGTTKVLRLSAAAADALTAYGWPGNVRELERLIERTVAFATTDVIDLEDLPPGVRGEFADTLIPALQRQDTMRGWGSRYARAVLARCRGNKRETCRVLDISYHTLVSYLNHVECDDRSAEPDRRNEPQEVPEVDPEVADPEGLDIAGT